MRGTENGMMLRSETPPVLDVLDKVRRQGGVNFPKCDLRPGARWDVSGCLPTGNSSELFLLLLGRVTWVYPSVTFKHGTAAAEVGYVESQSLGVFLSSASAYTTWHMDDSRASTSPRAACH